MKPFSLIELNTSYYGFRTMISFPNEKEGRQHLMVGVMDNPEESGLSGIREHYNALMKLNFVKPESSSGTLLLRPDRMASAQNPLHGLSEFLHTFPRTEVLLPTVSDNTPRDLQMIWPDLSDYGIELKLLPAPTAKVKAAGVSLPDGGHLHYMTAHSMSGGNAIKDHYTTLRELGFQATPKTGVLISGGMLLVEKGLAGPMVKGEKLHRLAELMTAFPETRFAPTDLGVVMGETPSAPVKPEQVTARPRSEPMSAASEATADLFGMDDPATTASVQKTSAKAPEETVEATPSPLPGTNILEQQPAVYQEPEPVPEPAVEKSSAPQQGVSPAPHTVDLNSLFVDSESPLVPDDEPAIMNGEIALGSAGFTGDPGRRWVAVLSEVPALLKGAMPVQSAWSALGLRAPDLSSGEVGPDAMHTLYADAKAVLDSEATDAQLARITRLMPPLQSDQAEFFQNGSRNEQSTFLANYLDEAVKLHCRLQWFISAVDELEDAPEAAYALAYRATRRPLVVVSDHMAVLSARLSEFADSSPVQQVPESATGIAEDMVYALYDANPDYLPESGSVMVADRTSQQVWVMEFKDSALAHATVDCTRPVRRDPRPTVQLSFDRSGTLSRLSENRVVITSDEDLKRITDRIKDGVSSMASGLTAAAPEAQLVEDAVGAMDFIYSADISAPQADQASIAGGSRTPESDSQADSTPSNNVVQSLVSQIHQLIGAQPEGLPAESAYLYLGGEKQGDNLEINALAIGIDPDTQEADALSLLSLSETETQSHPATLLLDGNDVSVFDHDTDEVLDGDAASVVLSEYVSAIQSLPDNLGRDMLLHSYDDVRNAFYASTSHGFTPPAYEVQKDPVVLLLEDLFSDARTDGTVGQHGYYYPEMDVRVGGAFPLECTFDAAGNLRSMTVYEPLHGALQAAFSAEVLPTGSPNLRLGDQLVEWNDIGDVISNPDVYFKSGRFGTVHPSDFYSRALETTNTLSASGDVEPSPAIDQDAVSALEDLGRNALGEMVSVVRYDEREVVARDGTATRIKLVDGTPSEDLARGFWAVSPQGAINGSQLYSVAKAIVGRALREPIDNAEYLHLMASALNEPVQELNPETISATLGHKCYDFEEAVEVMGVAAVAMNKAQLSAESPISFNDDAVSLARTLSSNIPARSFRTGSSMTNQAYSTPSPVSLLMQWAATHGREVGTLLEPTCGPSPSLASKLVGQADLLLLNELDAKRQAHLRNFSQMVPGNTQISGHDAFLADFRDLTDDREGVDTIVCNPPFGGLDKREIWNDQVAIQRADYKVALNSLASLKDNGRGVFLLAADNPMKGTPGVVQGGSKHFLNYLQDNYVLTGAYELDGKLYAEKGAGWPTRLYIVDGRGRTPDEWRIDPENDVIPTFSSLEVLYDAVAQQQMRRFRDAPDADAVRGVERSTDASTPSTPSAEPAVAVAGESTAGPANQLEDAEASAEATQRKKDDSKPSVVTYIPRSQLPFRTPGVVPANMHAGVQKSLDRLERNVGNVDQFLCKELEWTPEHLAGALSAEQADSTAMAIFNQNQGRGILIGDMTGFGKGRQAASVIWHAHLKGIPVIFATEKKSLFSDMYRDLTDIGVAHKLRMFLLNADGRIETRNPRTQKMDVIERHDADLWEQISNPTNERSQVEWPDNIDVLLMTYSQVNRANSKKQMVVEALSNGAMLVMDESHNAAGASNTFEAFDRFKKNAHATTYLSATAIKSELHFGIYADLLPATADPEGVVEMVSAMGDTALEAVSSTLAEDGGIVTRRHDMTGVEFAMREAEQYYSRNVTASNDFSQVLRVLGELSEELSSQSEQLNEVIEKLEAVSPEAAKRVRGDGVAMASTNFGSRVYQLCRSFELLASLDETADAAIEAVRGGEKPLIALQSTFESPVRDMVATALEMGVARETSAGVHFDQAPSFGDLLRRTVDSMQSVTTRNSYGVVEKESVESIIARAIKEDPSLDELDAEEMEQKIGQGQEAAQRLFERAKDLVSSSLDGFAASPIDYLLKRLSDAGVSADAISGRSNKLTLNADGSAVWQRHKKANATRITSSFQRNDIDALIITAAGAAGLSMHDSNKNPHQARRVGIVPQPQDSADTADQINGRICRADQATKPRYLLVSSGLPEVTRQWAIYNAKLRKMSAATTSDRKGASAVDAPDLMNWVGDRVVADFLRERLDVRECLADLGVEFDLEGEKVSTSGVARRFLGYLAVFKVDEREKLIAGLNDAFDSEVDRLDRLGVSPFKTFDLDIPVEILESTKLSGSDRALSAADEPLYLSKARITYVERPVTAEKVDSYLEGSEYGQRDLKNAISTLVSNENSLLTRAMAKRHKTLDEALADDNSRASALEGRINSIVGCIEDGLLPGATIEFSDSGETVTGVIVDAVAPLDDLVQAPGSYRFKVASPGRSISTLSLHAILQDEFYRIVRPGPESGTPVLDPAMRQAFNSKQSLERTEVQWIMHNNFISAIQQQAAMKDAGIDGGRIVNGRIGADSQAIERFLVLPPGTDRDKVMMAPINIPTVGAATHFLSDVTRTLGVVNGEKKKDSFTLGLDRSEKLVLRIPGKKSVSGTYLQDKPLAELSVGGNGFSGTKKIQRCEFNFEDAPQVVERLHSLGMRFNVSGEHREALNDYMRNEIKVDSSLDAEKPQPMNTPNEDEREDERRRLAAGESSLGR